MAWTPPRSWSIGQLVNAEALNVDVRDNAAHLKLLVDDTGKMYALSSTYLANLSGANLTGVAKTTTNNDFTAVNDFGAGAGARFIFPVGSDRWAN
jgi:hypothetical protein